MQYIDDYTYYIPLSNSELFFVRNRYHGKGYHGGSFLIYKNPGSTKFSELKSPLVRTKRYFELKLEKIVRGEWWVLCR